MAVNTAFTDACFRRPTDYTPVWFMRQAGRYLPGYKVLRKKHEVLEIAHTPELAATVSLEPVDRLGVDAAILFADIMLVPMAMGVDVKIVDAVGPVIDDPVAGSQAIERLNAIDASDISFLSDTIRLIKQSAKVPLIGFSGAPFTLASYLIEGRPSRTWIKTKRFMYAEPALWHALMDKLTRAIGIYLDEQVHAGVDALQLFDSWVGCLSPADFRQYVLPYNRQIFAQLNKHKVPRIMFGTDTGAMLADIASVDCEVVGVDWRTDIASAQKLLPNKALQGNLDPAVLLSGWPVVETQTKALLDHVPSRTGFIFNLGHGVLPDTSPDTLKGLVDYVHEH
jgi:uroporphyrinogen decarboxylase